MRLSLWPQSGVPLGEDVEIELTETFGTDLPVRASWQRDRIWEDGGMHKNGYLGQGLYVDPDRSLVIAWFGTGQIYDTDFVELINSQYRD